MTIVRLDTALDKVSAVAELVRLKHVLECPVCGELSAHAWCDVDEELGIAHIPTASCWEWECGHCGAHLVEADAPILAECYTHRPRR